MNETDWKPGDVALAMTEGGERVAFRCGVESNMGWEYAREPGQKTWSSDASGYVTAARRLLVIDPESDDQIDMLTALFNEVRDPLQDVAWTLRLVLGAMLEPPKPPCDAKVILGGVTQQCELLDGHTEPHAGARLTWSLR